MEQYIAKGVDSAIRYLHRRRIDAWAGEGEPFTTQGNTRRFAALASVIAGRSVEVVDIRGDAPPRPYWPIIYKMAHPALLPEHGFGWSDNDRIFMPVSISELGSFKLREEAALLLLFFASFQIKDDTLGFAQRNAAALSGDRMLADIFWIMENARLFNRIKSEYPGMSRSWPAIAGYYLDKRPHLKYLNGPEAEVEKFLTQTVAATLEPAVVEPQETGYLDSFNRAVEFKRALILKGFKIKKYRAIVPFFPWGKLMPERIKDMSAVLNWQGGRKKDTAKSVENAKDDRPDKPPKSAGRFAAKKEAVDEEANENGLTLNIYDKILSWADFANVTRPFDDDEDDDQKTKADEIEELTVSELDRTSANAFNAQIEKTDDHVANDDADDLSPEAFYYPEWDYRQRIYRADHSRIVERPIEAIKTDAAFYEKVLAEKRAVIKEVGRNLERLCPEPRTIGRQTDGTSIDFNSAIDAMADLHAGRTPDDRLYCVERRVERDLSALFLLDQSMSTDGWSGNMRIIDHEKQALVILCEALIKLRDRYSVYGFSGKGRKNCSFMRIKGFDEKYGQVVKNRINALIPYSYTRMGPAIRHASKILAKEKSRFKLLFVLSDGKPNDIDVYEGRYGAEDTRMSIKEAHAMGITPFCLTIDTGETDYLPALFGKGNYAVVSNAGMLAKKLPELYGRIINKL